jgi:hypothetical protein
MILNLVASLALVALIVREAMTIVEFGPDDPRYGAIGAAFLVGLFVIALAVWL